MPREACSELLKEELMSKKRSFSTYSPHLSSCDCWQAPSHSVGESHDWLAEYMDGSQLVE